MIWLSITIICILLFLLFSFWKQIRLFRQMMERSLNARDLRTPSIQVNFPLQELKRLAQLISKQRILLREELDDLHCSNENLRDQITSISHDLRTPLMAIQGYWELYENSKDPIEREQYLQTIKQRLSMLSQLIDDFYALTQLHRNEQNREHLTSTDPAEILTEMAFLFYDDCERRKLSVTPQIDAGIKVMADPQALRRVYANIFQNILRYGYGEVNIWHGRELPESIKKYLYEANIKLPDAKLFTVFGNQVGAKQNLPANCNHFFKRFYRGDLSRHHTEEISSGLGLYICKLLLDSQHFQIFACSSDEHPQRLFLVIAY